MRAVAERESDARGTEWAGSDPVRTAHEEYQAFPAIGWRDGLQAAIEVPLMARLLALPTGGRILEIGCGRGNALPQLARCCQPSRLTGVDIDAFAIAVATRRVRERGLTADLHVADARALPFDDASFDLVIDFGTCYHVREPERALAEVARVLAPGAWFVHETRASQLLAHPIRGGRRALPWRREPRLTAGASAVLWETHVKRDG